MRLSSINADLADTLEYSTEQRKKQRSGGIFPHPITFSFALPSFGPTAAFRVRDFVEKERKAQHQALSEALVIHFVPFKTASQCTRQYFPQLFC